MVHKKSPTPTWSSIKAIIANKDKDDLISLLGDLYHLSKENQTFLHSRFRVSEDILAPYKKIIKACMYPRNEKPIQIAKAKKAISDFSKAVGDPKGEIDLMIYFVECGTKFTVNYGDINETFYDALNRMYRRAIDKVLALQDKERGEFQSRLKAIVKSSSDIGWGYHDMLDEDYYSAFPEEV